MDQFIFKFTCIQFSGADVFFSDVSLFKVLQSTGALSVRCYQRVTTKWLNWKQKSKLLCKSLQKCPYSLHESLKKRYCAKMLVPQL